MEANYMTPIRLLFFSFISKILGKALNALAFLFLRKSSRLAHNKIKVILNKNYSIPDFFLYSNALIHAEDHRFYHHYGIDYIAIFRALYQTYFQHCRQGGSTIEQQLVRTLAGDYRKNYRRKFRELLIASTISSAFTKKEVLTAYLSIAHFGTGIEGIKKATKEITVTDEVTKHKVAYLIAHLRYPLPKYTEDRFLPNRSRRKAIIEYYCEHKSNAPFKLMRYDDKNLF